MDDSKSLNSTEKLLNTIRGEIPQQSEKPLISEKPSVHSTSIKKNIKHSLSAGIYFEDQYLSLVLTGKRKPSAKRELVKWAHVQIPDHLDINGSRFPLFLKSTISEFLAKFRKVALWTAIDSKYLKLRNITIPDIPDSKMANAALWGLKKEFDFDIENEIFDFEFISDIQVSGIKKKNIVAFAGDKQQIRFLKHLFSTAGYPLNGITAIPFALQNFIWTESIQIDDTPALFVIVNVSRYQSEISCLSDKGVLLTRNIRTGSYSLAEEIIESRDRKIIDNDITQILSAQIDRNSSAFATIEPSADRLLGKIIRTGDYCSQNHAANEPISKYFFFGETDNCNAFMEYAAELIPDKVSRFSPFEGTIVPLAIKIPTTAKERNGIIPALGISLSENLYTPNFLFTYIQKNIQIKYKRMNLVIAAAGLACLLACAGVFQWFKMIEHNEIRQKNQIETQLAGYSPIVTQDSLSKTIKQAQKKSEMINQYARDYLSLAIINEICSLTPENISIISFDSELSLDDPVKEKTPKEIKKKKRTVTIKGIVKTDFTDLESTLTGYVIQLGDSQLFGDILLQDKKIEEHAGSNILKFTADMEIL